MMAPREDEVKNRELQFIALQDELLARKSERSPKKVETDHEAPREINTHQKFEDGPEVQVSSSEPK